MLISNAARARKMLNRGVYTCVLCDDRRILTSEKHGIAPILERMDENLCGMAVADRIIGRAAALLLIGCKVESVHGRVMSRGAQALLERHGIGATYDTLTDQITNRDGTATCPMELAVEDVDDPALAPAILRTALETLQQKK